MIYIENIYVCLVAPMIISCFCFPKQYIKNIIFIICGITMCLLSAYINVFFTNVYSTNIMVATLEIAPLVEEIIKVLPILFYLVVFEPKKEDVILAMLIIAMSFAIFENICYLVEFGTQNFDYILIRGFGTSAMHILCGLIIGYGFYFTWGRLWLRVVGSLGVICVAITYHGLYNLFMSAQGMVQVIGIISPLIFIILAKIIYKLHSIR